MSLLDIRGLNVFYGESHILRDVDLSVAPGQQVFLNGRHGVAKTTLLKTVNGPLPPRSRAVAPGARALARPPTAAHAPGAPGARAQRPETRSPPSGGAAAVAPRPPPPQSPRAR